MAQLSLGLLGSFEMRAASGSTALAPGKKLQALRAILGVRPGQAHSRSRLASLLWADVGEDQARHSVRQAVFSLRRMLPEDVLTTTNETIAMNPDAVAVDVCEVEQLAAKATPETPEQAAPLYPREPLGRMRPRPPRLQ